MNALILIGLLTLSSCINSEAVAQSLYGYGGGQGNQENQSLYGKDGYGYHGEQKGSYREQERIYQDTNVDTQRNGPLPYATEQRSNRYERTNPYEQPRQGHGDKCRSSYYGC